MKWPFPVRILVEPNIDEAHFHQDLDLGYSWSAKGVPHWVKSTSPSLGSKINYYGAFDFTRAQCFL
ncbi:MAG: hypothetical protein WAM60_13910, partial [Candidatus Promineifilaceae bacterium]